MIRPGVRAPCPRALAGQPGNQKENTMNRNGGIGIVGVIIIVLVILWLLKVI